MLGFRHQGEQMAGRMAAVTGSVAAVQFGPVQHPIFPNLGLDLGFGSAKFLNL
jgi:hypothetical protein